MKLVDLDIRLLGMMLRLFLLLFYRGEDAVEKFLHSLKNEQDKINKIFWNPKPLKMCAHNEKDFQSATKCWDLRRRAIE